MDHSNRSCGLNPENGAQKPCGCATQTTHKNQISACGKSGPDHYGTPHPPHCSLVIDFSRFFSFLTLFIIVPDDRVQSLGWRGGADVSVFECVCA